MRQIRELLQRYSRTALLRHARRPIADTKLGAIDSIVAFPFLNGGLFEPLADYDWRKTDIVLPNRLFTNNERFDEFSTGTGVLDMFDRYNFTVNEAEPLEKEVAIDPEMLGKVFENLIEDNLRKGLGSYYTPREIVHYMCQESLINYLDTVLNTAEEPSRRRRRNRPNCSTKLNPNKPG